MTIVDTSVWIDYFRVQSQGLVSALNSLLDEDRVALAVPIRIEILSGASKKEGQTLKRLLEALPIFFPTDLTWQRMEEWVEAGLNRGERFGTLDLLIAAICHEQNVPLWSLDKDFCRMEKLGWVRRFTPS